MDDKDDMVDVPYNLEEGNYEGPNTQRNEESSSTHSDMLYIPQVMHGHRPTVGQEFSSLDEVYEFYNNYAREGGFSVRIGSSHKGWDNQIRRKEYVCYKEGAKRIKPNSDPKRERRLSREDCEAKLGVVLLQSSSKYKVSQFIEEHTHPLATPKRVPFLRSHRKVSDAQRSLTQQLSAANIPTHQQMSILELQAGGLQSIGCTERDIRNAKRDLKKVLDGHDAEMLHNYFLSEQEKNSAFTFTIESDNENCLTHCFWADATSRRAYRAFGDVVVFDTTYQTNKYSMIFAPLLGVNNHGQTILLGAAFLGDETTDSFVWLFEQWLKAMPGEPPKMIITDQDPAMSKAIAQVLPNTFHQYCIWHILKKFSKKIHTKTYMDFYPNFKKCIWDSETEDEFNTRWDAIVDESQLQGNGWLAAMFGLRQKWIPAYVKHIFATGMSSSQRAESSHSFFKRYFNQKNSLMDFVTCFNRALAKQRHKELNADHVDIDEQPILKTRMLMESQMAGIYTRSIFRKFQDELLKGVLFILTSTSDDHNSAVFDVTHASGEERMRRLVEEKCNDVVKYSCKKFEWEGIPCRHMVAFFTRKQVLKLPEKYILKRWTKAAKIGLPCIEDGVETQDSSTSTILLRQNDLYQIFKDIVDDAVLCEERYEKLREQLKLDHGAIKAIPYTKVVDISKSVQSNTTHSPFNEPNQVRAKGCGSRLKGGKEKATARDPTRRCHGCGKYGLHDKRNYPYLANIGTPQSSNDHFSTTGDANCKILTSCGLESNARVGHP